MDLGQLVDRLLERQHAALAHPVAEQVGGQRRVAELTDVRAGIGQTERAAVLPEQEGDAVDVVVGEHGADAEPAQVSLTQRQVEQEIERIDVRALGQGEQLGADQLRMRIRLHDVVRLPARRQALLVDPTVADALAPGRIGVRGAPLVERARHQLGEDGARVQRERLDHRHRERQRAAAHLRPDVGAAGAPPLVDLHRLQVCAVRRRQDRGVGDRRADARLHLVGVAERQVLAAVDADDTATAVADGTAQRFDLDALGPAARYRLAVGAAMGDGEARRETGRAGVHRLTDHRRHLGDLVSCRRS